MSAQTIKILVTAVLILHGVAYARALGMLLWQSLGKLSSSWLPVRSWMFHSMSSKVVAGVASIFWLLSTIGFFAATLAYWDILIPQDMWSQLAVIAAIISILGIIFISGIWPGAPNRKLAIFDTLIALVVDIAILVSQLWLHWPPI
jgi:hypothetical protein